MKKKKMIESGEMEIDLSELNMSRCNIASCAQAKVFKGIYKGRDVAIKFMRSNLPTPHHQHDEFDTSTSSSSIDDQQQFTSSSVHQHFKTEVAILSSLHHPNILQYIASSEKPPVYLILTEFMSKGDLRMFLDKQKPYSLSTKTILRLALDISRGMEYLHSQGIVHGDLKSSNLLLNDDMHVKVADFGTSRLETQCRGEHIGTYRWMAPEMIKGKRYTRKVDVYSFGMVLWELATSLLPFRELNPVQAAFAVSEKEERPLLPENCHPGIAQLIARCWATNSSKRPEFSEIVRVLEKYCDCVKNGLPLPLDDSELVRQRTISERLKSYCACFNIGSSMSVHPSGF